MNEREVKEMAVAECYLTSLDCGLSPEEAESQVYFAASNKPGYDSAVISRGLSSARLVRLEDSWDSSEYPEAFAAAWGGLELPE